MKNLKKAAISVVVPVVFFGLLEATLCISGFTFTPREKVGYIPWVAMKFGTVIEHYQTLRDPPGYFWVMPTNSWEFMNDPHLAEFKWPDRKTEGKKLLAFIGGSTTQPDWLRAYPRRCVGLLNAAAGSDEYELLNCGMSSYSTHQSLIALQRYVLPRKPDCVVVFHGWNDPNVSQSGHSDIEIDRLYAVNDSIAKPRVFLERIRSTRLALLVALIMEKLDLSWPRQRVSWKRFEENMNAMARICSEHGVPMVIVSRPASRLGQRNELSDLMLKHYSRDFGTNRNDIYFGIHSVCTTIQARVAGAYPDTRLAPATDYINRKQLELEARPDQGVSLFIADDLHLEGLGNQYLAECVAMTIATELQTEIEELTHSYRYWSALAEEFAVMDSPFECLYAVGRAREYLADEDTSRLDEMEHWAKNQFEFFRVFERCRWDNAMDVSLDERLTGLEQCLLMRPSDFGVVQQIVRVCVYLDTSAAQAFPYIANFKASSLMDHYRWLKLCMVASVDAKQYQEAIKVAKAILELNPNDSEARKFLSELR